MNVYALRYKVTQSVYK